MKVVMQDRVFWAPIILSLRAEIQLRDLRDFLDIFKRLAKRLIKAVLKTSWQLIEEFANEK